VAAKLYQKTIKIDDKQKKTLFYSTFSALKFKLEMRNQA